jgi:arginine decarboxylase
MDAKEWTIEKSRVIYGVGRRDLHFLDINENGELFIRFGDKSITFDELIGQIQVENGKKTAYTSSFTLRMPQMIDYQIKKLKTAFTVIVNQLGYSGQFGAVYPVKVNQRKDCVIPVLQADRTYGLEAGTKAELFLIKSVIRDEKDRLIICNGAKDPEYLHTIEQFVKEGYNIAISIESLHEAKLIVDLLEPEETNLVLRIKPYLTVRGHWSHSAGRNSKFGLSIHDLFDVIALLKERGFEDSVSTVLGHVGSQITAIADFHGFSKFMARVFYELRNAGLDKLHRIDFGGGLPIDYTSSHEQNLMELYARALVEGIMEWMAEQGETRPPPDIMIESGRGITALYSLVVVKALEVRSVFPPSDGLPSRLEAEKKEWALKMAACTSLNELVDVWNEFLASLVSAPESLETLREREQFIGEMRAEMRRNLPRVGSKSLRSDRVIESIWHPDNLVIGNFSVFNAAGDHVLVQQHFPIIPVRDLNVRPETTVRLADITCDSDGEISQFHHKDVGEVWFTRDNRPIAMPYQEMGIGIPVGQIRSVQGSYFVIALTGAYQDVIEMNHNLLGDLPDVALVLSPEGEWNVTWVAGAQAMEDILKDLGYSGINVHEDPYMSD